MANTLKSLHTSTELIFTFSVGIKAVVVKGENSCSMEASDDSFGANKVKYLSLEIAAVESDDEASVSFEPANKKRRLLSASLLRM